MTTKQINTVAITVLVVALAMVWLAPTTVPALVVCVAALLAQSRKQNEAAATHETAERSTR